MPRWGFILAVVAVAFLAPDVQAGCGDYVVITSPTEVSATETPTPSHPLEPCHGPYCSRQPDPTPFVPAAPAASPVEQAACVSLDPVPPAARDGVVFAPSSPFDPVTRPFRLERPPRP